MGNHDRICLSCEEDEHDGACDPEKEKAVTEKKANRERIRKLAQARMFQKFDRCSIPYELDEYGNAIIRWVNFTEGIS